MTPFVLTPSGSSQLTDIRAGLGPIDSISTLFGTWVSILPGSPGLKTRAGPSLYYVYIYIYTHSGCVNVSVSTGSTTFRFRSESPLW